MYLFDPENWQWLGAGGNLTFLLEAFLVNMEIAVVAMILSLVFALCLALLRVSKNRIISVIAAAWIDVWRNLPLIFVLLFFSLWIPESVTSGWVEIAPGFLPAVFKSPFIVAAVVGLVLYNSSVIAEIMRAGIQSLERGQGEAALALGMPYWKAMKLVILPQGLRRMVPATVSQLITLHKDTSLCSIITIRELVRSGRIVTQTSGSPFADTGVDAPILQVFVFVGILFVIVNYLLSRLSQRLEIKERERTGVEVEKVTGLEDQLTFDSPIKG